VDKVLPLSIKKTHKTLNTIYKTYNIHVSKKNTIFKYIWRKKSL